jgi:uridine kinase
VNNYVSRLNVMLVKDCTLDLLDLRDPSANMTYQISLTLLYLRAVHEVLGPEVKVTIANSLSKGLFTVIHAGGVTDETADAISLAMRRMADADLPFNGRTVCRREMLEIASHLEDGGRRKEMFENAPDLESAQLYELAGEQEFFYHDMVPSTRYLKWFEVRRYKNGMLLRFPHPSRPDEMQPYEEQKLLYEAFSEATRWERLMGVEETCSLNELVLNDRFQDMVLLSEALHEKRIAEIAGQIHDSGKRIILIAGPSSSGKTTFARRLCIQLRVAGLRPLYLGTDDFFVDREDTPLNENGERDYESLNALDIDLFTKDMNELLRGKKVDLPEYDFLLGSKIYGRRITSIENSQPIVIEGIHGLNPMLTAGIPDSEKFRIYISPLTQLNIDGHSRIPTTDARMLRRIVRDHKFRGYSAEETIHSWPNVRSGEDRNIFVFADQADVFFNSNCIYELAVLKRYAEPLLKRIRPEQPEYPEARRMLEFLALFAAVQDDSIIPNNSIMREFIGGSVLV